MFYCKRKNALLVGYKESKVNAGNGISTIKGKISSRSPFIRQMSRVPSCLMKRLDELIPKQSKSFIFFVNRQFVNTMKENFLSQYIMGKFLSFLAMSLKCQRRMENKRKDDNIFCY